MCVFVSVNEMYRNSAIYYTSKCEFNQFVCFTIEEVNNVAYNQSIGNLFSNLTFGTKSVYNCIVVVNEM